MSPRQSFQFKQFQVFQDQCAMKVSLDACLLGACCDVEQADRILDIGTGTGLLALMLAQKSHAPIDAVEIDNKAFNQAQENVQLSPFAQQIQLYPTSIQRFSETRPANRYHTIICNPPFFSQHLSSQDPQRNLARHNHSLSFEDLSQCMSTLISESGFIWLLLPQHEHTAFQRHAHSMGLYLNKRIDIIPREEKSSKLGIWVYRKHKPATLDHTSLVVYKSTDNEYTNHFKELLCDYYLKL